MAVLVAVGVLCGAEGRVLIARRHSDSHQGGLWEFPGGKVEAGESVEGALARELREELGVTVTASRPLLTVEHDYGDKAVCLDVHLVTEFLGTPESLEGQPLTWVLPDALDHFPFPAANTPIVAAVQDYARRR